MLGKGPVIDSTPMRSLALVALFLVFGGIAVSATPTVFSRSERVGPVALTHDDLFRIVERIRNLVETANGPAGDAYVDEQLEVQTSSGTVAFGLAFSRDNLKRAPKKATDISYTYRRGGGAPVSQVDMRLDDFRRELKVAGSSGEQVDALTRMTSADLREHGIWFGGDQQRSICGLGLILLVALLLALGIAVKGSWFGVAMSSFGLLLTIAIFAVPWQKLFPGVVLYSSDASWLSRNSPIMTLVGVILGLVGIGIAVYFGVKSLPPRATRVPIESAPKH
jgi:hypothetical protein